MGEDLSFLNGAISLLSHVDKAFTFLLLVLRFSGMFLLAPGLGGQARGLSVKYPAILVLSFAAMYSSPVVALPTSIGLMVAMMFSEVILGAVIGMIPLLVVAIVQNASQLSSTSMGLQSGAVIDPSTGGQTADIARLLGDLVVIAFFFVGGHRVMIYAVSGLGGRLIPGSFVLGEHTIELLIQRSSDIFSVGMLLASPVIVALLLTQFVMGLIAKAVPTINVFIISFPLTIGIGLVLIILMIPEIMRAIEPMLTGIESNIYAVMTEVSLK